MKSKKPKGTSPQPGTCGLERILTSDAETAQFVADQLRTIRQLIEPSKPAYAQLARAERSCQATAAQLVLAAEAYGEWRRSA